MPQAEFDRPETAAIEQIATRATDPRGRAASARTKDAQIIQRARAHRTLSARIRERAGGTTGAFKRGAARALSAVPGGSFVQRFAGSPTKAIRTGVIASVILGLTGRAAREAERIRAYRAGRGRPFPGTVTATFGARRDIEGKALLIAIREKERLQWGAVYGIEAGKALIEGHGLNTFNVAATETRRSVNEFRGGNIALNKAVNVMEDRFNRELRRGWKKLPGRGG